MISKLQLMVGTRFPVRERKLGLFVLLAVLITLYTRDAYLVLSKVSSFLPVQS